MGEYQQGQERDDVQGQHGLVAEESLVPERGEGKRHEEQIKRLRAAHEQSADGEDQEHQEDVPDLVGFVQQHFPVGEIHCQEKQHHKHEGEKEIACPLHGPGSGITHVRLVFNLVGIKHLGYLRRDYLTVGDYQLSGVHEALGG